MPRYSVKKPLTIIVATLAVVLLGVIAFTSMSTDLLPEMDLPYVVVMTTYPGATPEKVETTVTKPLEQGLSTASGLSNITSISQENMSLVILEFNQGTNMDSVMIELSGSIDLVKAQLDEGVSTPTMMKMNPDMLPVMVASADVEGMDFQQACALISEKVIPDLERVNGVASVTGSGLLEQSVQVSISQDKIDALNKRILTAVDSELAEAEEKLDEAEASIQSGYGQINQQEKQFESQKEQLAQGVQQLDDALAQAQSGLEALAPQRETLAQGAEALRAQIGPMEQQLSELQGREDTLTEEEAQQLAQLQAALPPLRQQLAEAEGGLEAMDGQIAALETTVSELGGKLTEAQSAQSQLAAAESEVSSQLKSARSKLASGQKELDAQREAFEKARDEALEKANISEVVTADMIGNILTAQNFSMPAGYLSEGEEQFAVKVGDQYSSVEQMKRQMLFTVEAGDIGTVYLEDVADVMVTDNANELYAKINGNDGVLLSFQKQSTAATTDVTHAIHDAMDRLEGEVEGLRLVALQDQGVYIDMIIDSVLENLVMGGILAIVVLLIFLRSGRPTLIIALSIPMSLLFAVVLMYFSGVTLNIISLAGLALGVGMLVDNSIVVIENIYRLRSEGMPAAQAAVKGAGQVAGAIIASTLTTICVFLPIVFTEGITRQLFTDMGLTIAYSLVASLIIALTLVPALASTMLKDAKEKRHRIFDSVTRGYGRGLNWSLRHKAVVLVLALALLGVSAAAVVSMGTAFMPEADSDQLSATLEMPEGSTTQQRRDMSAEVIERILEIPDVETVGAMEGSGMMLSGASDSVSYYMILKEGRTMSSDEVVKAIEDKTGDLDCTLTLSANSMDLSALGGSGMDVVIEGDDLDTLRALAGDMAELLRQTEGTTQIDDGLESGAQEIRVVVDKNKAMERNLTVAQVYQQVAAALQEENTATNVTLSNETMPVIVVENSRLTRENLAAYTWTVTDSAGEEKTLRLSDVAKVYEAEGFSAIRHDNQVRTLTVSCQVDDAHNIGLVSREFEKKLAAYETPAGYNIRLSGENETINNTLRDLVTMILLAVALIYLIMVAQFQSWLSPFIVIFTIPLAFTGGLLALWAARMEISMIAMLGFLMLSGVIVNNGIVFVDYVNQLRQSGMEKREALLEAGKTRLRPILMTTLTTVLALVTLAMGMGSGAEMLQPMAVVMIGGLTYATLMTLFVVPSLYDIFQRRPMRTVELEEEK